ncbi:hypothetical protein D3C75_692650 [compost metagenome]
MDKHIEAVKAAFDNLIHRKVETEQIQGFLDRTMLAYVGNEEMQLVVKELEKQI